MADMVGFYSLLPTPDGKGHLGALLVTDEIGKPQEFRVTYPVKPTLLQRQLYGQTLIPHLGVELCGKPLYDALKNKPKLLIVDSEDFVPLLAKDVPCPVAYVTRYGEAFTVVSDAGDESLHEAPLRSPSGRFQPLAVTYPYHYSQDERKSTKELLTRFFEQIDLTEPFDRIKKAAEHLPDLDERFR